MSESVNLANVFVTLIPSMAGSQGTITKELTSAVVGPADKAGLAGGAALGGGVLSRAKKVLAPAAVAAAVAGVGTGLYKIGSTFKDVTDTIRVGTGASGDALDGLVASAKNVGRKVPADFNKIGDTIADVNTRFGLSGGVLETVASQYLEAGRILGEDVDINKTSAAFSAFKIEGDAVVDGMDTLFQVSQATGVGMNELASGISRSAPAVQALGFSFEDTAAMVGSLDKAGLNSNQIMSSMSRSLVQLAKDGEDPKDAFARVTGELEGFIAEGDKASAIDLAGKVFGTRGASQFVGAIESGTISLEGMMAATGATEDTILGLGAETMHFAEKWEVVKNNAMVALEPLGSAVFDALGDALGTVMPYLESFGDWMQENPTAIKIFGGILIGLAAAMGIVTAAMWAMSTTPIAWAIMGIVVAVTAVVAAIVLLWKNWDKIWGWIKDKFGVVVDWIKDKWEQYGQPVIDAFGEAFEWLYDNVIDPVVGWITDKWEELTDSLAEGWAWIDDHVIDPFRKAIDWLGENFEVLKAVVADQWDTLVNNLERGWKWVDDHVFKPIKKGLDWVSDRFEVAKKVISDQWDTLKSNLQRGWNWIDNNVFAPIKKGADWVGDKFDSLKRIVTDQWDTLKSNLKRGWDWINDKVFEPLKKGTENMSKAFRVAKDMIKEQWDKLKKIAATPINFIINKVYTDGIKRLVESTASKLGLTISLPHISPIAMSQGGKLPGFGGGDRIPTILEAGEFVINKHASRKYHPLLAAINGGYGVAPGTVGAAMSSASGCGGGSCGVPGLSKGGWLAGVGNFFADVGRGVGAFLSDPLGAVAELITKPIEAMLGPVANTVWGDLGKGGVKKILTAVPDWFKKKTEKMGNAGLVGAAQNALGVPYIWGGSSIPPGLDCSGLVYWAAQQLGLGWPRLTAAGYQSASAMKGMSAAIPGDLLFWGNPAHHVAIMTGPGQMVHAPRPGTTVTNAAIYGSPSVGTYRGGGGAGMRSTYAGLVSSTAARANSSADFVRQLRMQQYDSGGLLQPGYTLAYNGTGKPETIRTAEQEAALRGGLPDTLVLRFSDEREFEVYVEDVVGAGGSLQSVMGVGR